MLRALDPIRRRISVRWAFLAAAVLTGALVLAACSGSSSPTPSGSGGGGNQTGSSNLSSLLTSEELARLASLGGIVGGSQQLGVWVNGIGTVTVAPDVGTLGFAVEARDTTVAPARARAAAAMDAVLRSLRANGVEDRDIQTRQFSIRPLTTRGESVPTIVGYVVTNSATAKIRDIDSIGPVIDDAAAAGGDAIRINSIGFTIDDPKPLEAQARELALNDAMAKAQQIAQVTGVTLGDPVFISESGGFPVVAQEQFRVAFADGVGAPTPISPGESQVTVRVQMVFGIQ